MQTKIEAAKICQLAGCSMVIANGLSLNPISMISKKIFAHGSVLKFQNLMLEKNGS